MADLKAAAAKRSGKTTSSLGSAAKARAKSRSKAAADDGMSIEDPIVPKEQYKPSPDIISGQAFDQPPPLPPALQYLRMFATIPALRKKVGPGGGMV